MADKRFDLPDSRTPTPDPARIPSAGIVTGKAILVRYAGPTDYRGSRWIATADDPIARAVVPYRSDLSAGAENARTAADALLARWADDWARSYPDSPAYPWTIRAAGWLPNGDYVFVVA